MRMKRNIKSKLAGVLVAVMVISVPVPGIQAYALSHGAQAIIEFDPQSGPSLSESNYNSVPRRDNGVSFATGKAGYPLTSSSNFTGILTDNFGSGHRPKIPVFNVTWEGYTFDGWYNEAGNKIQTLPYAFPYSEVSKYKAVWKGNATTPFNFKVMHYRDLNKERDNKNDGKDETAWPSDSSTDLWKFFESADETRQVMANTPISATYRRDIPGYRLKSVLIKNNKIRKYSEESGEGTLEGGANVNPTTKAARGSMPNDDLTIAYRYEPDPTKKFAVHIEYVDASGAMIKTSERYTLPAETEFDIPPAEIKAYILRSGKIKTGSGEIDDLEGHGIYSATTAGCAFDDQRHFKGKMPNQPVTITYTYDADPNVKTILQVKRQDNNNAPLEDDEIKEVSPADSIVINVEKKAGYDYPPNIQWDSNFTGNQASFNTDAAQLTLRTDVQGGTVSITYNEKLSDESYWAKIEYYNGGSGEISGETAPRFKKHSSYRIEDLTSGITPEPSDGYLFDGWYKANDTGSDKEGGRLEDSVDIREAFKLYASFYEDPNKWSDLTFRAGAKGSISGNTSIHTAKGTSWTSLILPVPKPDKYYKFAGWFDESGNKVQDSQTVLANQIYIARFVPIGLPDDGILSMPDARAAIDADGSGRIMVSGANEDRKYAVTDVDQKVLEIKTGMGLRNSDFMGLEPSTSYYVYELTMEDNPSVGAVLPESVDADHISPPTQVNMPALGSNYTVSEDLEEGKMQLEINPAAPDTRYALLTMEGETVFVPESDENGWVAPSGSPQRYLFTKLVPNQLYVAVAKRTRDTATPRDKMVMGTQIAVVEGIRKENDYTVKLINGGYIEEITRNGYPLEIGNKPTTATVKKGDVVKINAELSDSHGQTFKQWSSVIGTPDIFAARRNQPIIMPAGNVVLQVTYKTPPLATSGNATIEYTPKDGKTALDLSGNRMETLTQELTDNSGDRDVMKKGIDVVYTVKFKRRVPTASESNAVMEELEHEDDVKVPWVLTSSITRKVGGTNKELTADSKKTPDVRLYSVIDNSLLGYLDYKLWKVEASGGSPVSTQVVMEPDPNDSDSGFTGIMSFDGSVGSKYILTYVKAHEVTIIDGKRGKRSNIKVKSGTALAAADSFKSLEIFEDYTDPITGRVYEYGGVGKTASSSIKYDIDLPVTKSMTLYVLYKEADDSKWQQARKNLMEQISIAQALMNNTSVSEEEKQTLSNAINEALEVANRIYRPAVEEVMRAYESLKAVVDSISSGGGVDPDDPGNPDIPDNPDTPERPDTPDSPDTPERPDTPDKPDKPDVPDKPDRPSGGPSGIVRAVKRGQDFMFNNYRTYSSSRDGTWEQVEDGGWTFVLNSGARIVNQWVNMIYEQEDQTYTYHFNKEGIMNTGWYVDKQGDWYLLDTAQGGNYGRLMLGWVFDDNSGTWYYLNQFTGSMLVGWQQLGQDWYYLNPVSDAEQPIGALYVNGITPDGYLVDEDGKWIRETP